MEQSDSGSSLTDQIYLLSGNVHRLTANEESKSVTFFYITFICMMLFFFFGMAVIEKYKPKYGHETCYTLILGMTISCLVYAIKGPALVETWKFSSDLFFDWFLPPIIMNSGFNMYK